MNTDIDLFGIFLPPMVLAATAAFAIWIALKRVLATWRVYRFVTYRNLVDLSLYFVILAGLLAAFGGKTIVPLL